MNGPPNCFTTSWQTRSGMPERIVELLFDRRQTLSFGDFPMVFTDTHDLSLDYLVNEMIFYQKQDMAAIGQCINELRMDLPARALAEEILGQRPGTFAVAGRAAKNAGGEHLKITFNWIQSSKAQRRPSWAFLRRNQSQWIEVTLHALIDTHAHLDQEEFDADRADVIARAIAAGVEMMVAVGVTADSSAATVELAAEHPAIFAAVGIQPNYCAQAEPGDWDRIRSLGQLAEGRRDWRNRAGPPLGLHAVCCPAGLFRSPHPLVAGAEPAIYRSHPRKRCRRFGDAASMPGSAGHCEASCTRSPAPRRQRKNA